MKNEKPETLIAVTKPTTTHHLNADQKKALDVQADAEHTTGPERERLTIKFAKLGGAAKPAAD